MASESRQSQNEPLLLFDDKASLKQEVILINDEIDYTLRFSAFLSESILQTGSSFVFSPLSCLVNIASLLCGVNDEVRTAACDLLFGNKAMDERRLQLLGQVKHHLIKHKERFLRMLSFLIVSSDFHLSTKYGKMIKLYFDATTEQGHLSQDTQTQIDELVQHATDAILDFNTGLITFDNKVKMVLVDCNYFLSAFKGSFKAGNTLTDFHNEDGTVTSACFLYSSGDFRIGTNIFYNCEVLQIPFVGNELFLNLICPQSGKLMECFTKAEENSTIHTVCAILRNTKLISQPVDVYIPKFELRSKISLRNFLEEIGLTSLFNPKEADYSKMQSESNGQALTLHDIIQTSMVGIGENVDSSKKIRTVEDAATFICNYPFGFALTSRVENTMIVLHLGVIRSLKPE